MAKDSALAAREKPASPSQMSEDDLALERVGEARSRLPAEEQRLFDAIFRGAPPEDVTRYDAASLAALASLVFEATSSRAAGQTLVRLIPFVANGSRSETILVAVNDDMPFLFDSLMGELSARGLRVQALFHPIVAEKRGTNGRRDPAGTSVRESLIVLALHALSDETRAGVAEAASYIFSQVRLAVADWPKMLSHLRETIGGLCSHPPKINAEIVEESAAFLEWLADNHFTFLGTRDYVYRDRDGGRLDAIEGSGLGVLSSMENRVIRRGERRGELTSEIIGFLSQAEPLIITKSNERSVVHRRVHMDYVGVKTYDTRGNVTGERRFVGLFTSGAYSRRPSDIPLLRLKVSRVVERAGFRPDSHDGKALAHILDSFPRDELFQISEDELFETALGILRLGERPKVRVFVRCDRFDRFVSALVYVPRDRYDTHAREKIHAILGKAFNGRMSASNPTIDNSVLARVHYIIGRKEGPRPKVDVRELESEIRKAIRTWEDGFATALVRVHGEARGMELFARYGNAFPARYRDAYTADEAVRDLDELEQIGSADSVGITARAYREANDAHSALRLKIYVRGGVMPLSASLPVFENLGFRVIAEDSYPLSLETGRGWKGDAAVLDFLMERADEGAANLEDIKQPVEDAFQAIVSGRAENDGFNRLIIGAGIDWRSVNIVRAAAKYSRQAGFAFSQEYIEQAVARNPDIARLIVELFDARHNPSGEGNAESVHKRIDAALNDVPSLDDDRIIRRLRNIIECSLRTNFYQHDENGGSKAYLSIKLDSQKIEELPAPRPLFEIFVYSPEVEGVHLRFGKVARGGIRWSDRREDFRTEVLGLVKAQQVKNAVIVPVGAKGGFYPKQLPPNGSREEVQAAGIAAYKTFINALLDVTDNIATDGAIIPPVDVRRHDSDDPYLVVAADKGTATFSDIANGIAESRGFWLGDAFASGGSHGYDHKKMGITAKGAWVAVQRHFRELGRDIQNEPFTCIGVGDMSGDVFGNGMLLSKCTKLVAAFDHRHIFIDPDPDAASSFAERKRMFDLPRSSWDDYNKSLISKGGGVFSRTLKEIPLSPEVQRLTGLVAQKASPVEVMKALLKSEIDLLWFGGIGTFIKSKSQTNLDVGDRANDAVRVNGGEVQARVIGEGANLGVTQLGRVEYARRGGRINTDAIDNSAGVDTSDHEVNLKILFSGPMRRNEVSPAERDKLLEQMTDDVAAHVLKDNYDQTLALSVAQARGLHDLDAQGRFMRDLERRGKLSRAVEFLPDDESLRKRGQEGVGLTRPELAVLLAYAKLDLDPELLESDLPDDAYFGSALANYYPRLAVEKLPGELPNHRLRREIISTVITNRIVNMAGPVFIHRMKEISGSPAARVARAFAVAEGAFRLDALKARIDALDYKVPADVQTGMYTEIAELLRRSGFWFLVNIPANADLAETVARYHAGVEALRGTFSSLVSDYEMQDTMARITGLMQAGVPEDLAHDVAALPLWATAPEIAQLAYSRKLDVDLVAGAYFSIGAIVGIDRLRGLASRIAAAEHWDRLAIRRIADDLFSSQRVLTSQALRGFEGDPVDRTRVDGSKAAEKWAGAHEEALARTRSFLAELERGGELSIARLTLANSQIRELASE